MKIIDTDFKVYLDMRKANAPVVDIGHFWWIAFHLRAIFANNLAYQSANA